jgi:hypothetical protein
LGKAFSTAQGRNSRHRQIIGGQPMNSYPLNQFPRGILPAVWDSTNPAEIES